MIKFKLLKKDKKILHPIKDWQGYYITREGEVFANTRHNNPESPIKIMKPQLDQNGYWRVRLTKKHPLGKNKRVHKLLMEAFVPNPNNYKDINHINAITTDNRFSNLEWCTRSHNQKEAIRLGLRAKNQGTMPRPVQQFSLNGDLIAEYDSVVAAGKSFGKKSGFIGACCTGVKSHKTAYGYIWRYKNENK